MDERARHAPLDAETAPSPVRSHNEWDPLEEIIVGRLEGATIPFDHPIVSCNIPGLARRAQALARAVSSQSGS
jgi:glycine amidinotransferase